MGERHTTITVEVDVVCETFCDLCGATISHEDPPQLQVEPGAAVTMDGGSINLVRPGGYVKPLLQSMGIVTGLKDGEFVRYEACQNCLDWINGNLPDLLRLQRVRDTAAESPDGQA